MHTAVVALPGRDRVLAATQDHPYARLTAIGEQVRGFVADRVVACSGAESSVAWSGSTCPAWTAACSRRTCRPGSPATGCSGAPRRGADGRTQRGRRGGDRVAAGPRSAEQRHPAGEPLGTALAAAMTRRLIAEYGVVGLGMTADRPGLTRLYQRLGFTQAADRTSVEVA